MHRTLFLFALAAALVGTTFAADCVPQCMNGGVCTKVEGLDNEFFCKCKPGWMGQDCRAKYTPCTDNLVCYNGGQCVGGSTPGSFQCACPPTWTDPQCKTALLSCNTTGLVCMNGGSCEMDTLGPYCKCPPNIRGRNCQFGVTECADGMYCMNGGLCKKDGGCTCQSGFFGFHCQNSERDPNVDQIARSNTLPGWAIALIVIACVVAVGGAILAGVLIYKEKKGKPVFHKWDTGSAAAGLPNTM